MAKIKFCGACGEVTGSRHLIETSNENILLDCGLFQGKRSESRDKNLSIPFDTKEIDAVFISHAHIDHCGSLPILVKKGFNGNIFLNQITSEIAEIMLKDSARLQASDAEFFNKIHSKEGLKISPLYEEDDAMKTISLFRQIDSSFEMKDIKISLYHAGHVLGSAQILLEVENAKILYTGDVGRRDQLLLKAPEFPKDIDYLIMETTYGDREHPDVSQAANSLLSVIKKAIDKRSKIIIPSFSLERTQEIIFILDFLKNRNMIGELPVYVDSPMSVEITKIFNKHLCQYDFNKNFCDYVKTDKDPFGYDYIKYISDKRESQSLNEMKGPMIIISASGMCEGGRILHHLRNSIENEDDILLLVGYQAYGTLGRKLKDGEKQVKIFGIKHDVYMEVISLDFFSAHGDKNDLLSYVKEINPKKGIFLVHGENQQRIGFSNLLKENGFNNIIMPDYLSEFDI